MSIFALIIEGSRPHHLYCLARDKAPEFAEKWKNDLLDSYIPDDDGEDGTAQIEIGSMKELRAGLLAFEKHQVGLSCDLSTESVHATATLGPVFGGKQEGSMEVYINAKEVAGSHEAAMRQAVTLLVAALSGRKGTER